MGRRGKKWEEEQRKRGQGVHMCVSVCKMEMWRQKEPGQRADGKAKTYKHHNQEKIEA